MLIVFTCAQLLTVENFMVKHEIVVEILAFEIDTRIMDALLVYKIARKVPSFSNFKISITQKLSELGN